jgi:hypothetical protein
MPPEDTEVVETAKDGAAEQGGVAVAEPPSVNMSDDEVFDMFGVRDDDEDAELEALSKGVAAAPEEKPAEGEQPATEEGGEAPDDAYVPQASYMELLEKHEALLAQQSGTVLPQQMEQQLQDQKVATADGVPSAPPQTEAPQQAAPLAVPDFESFQMDDSLVSALRLDDEQAVAMNTILRQSNKAVATAVTQSLHSGLQQTVLPLMARLFPVLTASAKICEARPEMERYPGVMHATIAEVAAKNPELGNRPSALAEAVIARLNVAIPQGERRAKNAEQKKAGPRRFATTGTPAANRGGDANKAPLSIEDQINDAIMSGVSGASFLDEL